MLNIATVFSMEQECFQGVLESWRGMHQLEFCCQPVACLRGSHFIRPSTESWLHSIFQAVYSLKESSDVLRGCPCSCHSWIWEENIRDPRSDSKVTGRFKIFKSAAFAVVPQTMLTVQQKNFNRCTIVIEIYFMFMILCLCSMSIHIR